MHSLIYFKVFVDSKELWPEDIADDLLNKVRNELESFADQMDIESDPDEARDDAASLEALGEKLEVNVSATVNELESYAQELESGVEETSSQGGWRWKNNGNDDCLDDEIV